jgi:hypothetical protein
MAGRLLLEHRCNDAVPRCWVAAGRS